MKTEKPTKTRKVQLMPIMANVQKLISPSPKIKVQLKAEAEFLQKTLYFSWSGHVKNQVDWSSFTWEVVGADFLGKQLVVLLHDDPSRSWDRQRSVLCPLLVHPSQPWDKPLSSEDKWKVVCCPLLVHQPQPESISTLQGKTRTFPFSLFRHHIKSFLVARSK